MSQGILQTKFHLSRFTRPSARSFMALTQTDRYRLFFMHKIRTRRFRKSGLERGVVFDEGSCTGNMDEKVWRKRSWKKGDLSLGVPLYLPVGILLRFWCVTGLESWLYSCIFITSQTLWIVGMRREQTPQTSLSLRLLSEMCCLSQPICLACHW